jgi:hypothetical protein
LHLNAVIPKMTKREDILKELSEISTFVAGIPPVNVYKVDSNYFDGIRAETQARIIASNFITLDEKRGVPEGYFENLSSTILEKIKAADFSETAQISPLVASIGNKNVYSIPDSYFESLTVSKETEPKVVKMGISSVFKYAVAAVVVGLLGFGLFTFLNDSKKINIDEQNFAAIKAGNEILKKGTFNKELELITDKELENYLSQNGEDVSAALVASSTDDEEKLPEAVDYLMDENTLNDFLKNNNLAN